MSQPQKLLIIDGHSLAYRAYHALPVDKFSSPQGVPVNAVYGLCSMLINLLAEHKPDYLAVCFDEGRDTFRKSIFSEYKSNRAKSPDEFRVQVSLIRSMIDAFGITSFSDSQYEADDLIASIVHQASSDKVKTLVVTSDRDSFQLISENVHILYPKKGLSDVITMDSDELFSKYGLSPAQYADFAALRGDPSDNLPGIPGVGEKTALAWIQKYGSLEDLLINSSELTGKVGESLRANSQVVQTNSELTRLVDTVPINAVLSDLKWEPSLAEDSIRFATEMGFRSLLPRLSKLIGEKSKLPTRSSEPIALELPVIFTTEQQIFILDNSGFTVQEYGTAKELKDGLNNKADEKGFIVPDLKFLAKRFLSFGDEMSANEAENIYDILLLEYIANPGSRPQIDDFVINKESDQLFTDNGSEKEICSAIASAYLKIARDLNFNAIKNLYQTLESAVTLVIASMEHHGIAINVEKLRTMIGDKEVEQQSLEQAGYKIHGREFNFGSPKQLQDVLFVERGLSKTKKTKTGFTTDADALTFLIEKHPDDELLPVIQEWRETSKIKQMLVSLLESTQSGRIHTTFNQTVAATGRLSSTKPNLQNVPVRTDAGKAIRNLFVSDEPYGTLITADYSQIELRVMAHLAKDAALIDAFKSGEDLHKSVASQIYGVPAAKVTTELRNQIKAVSYGLAYGLSTYGLSQSLRIDVSEADDLMRKFFERFDGVRKYLKEVVSQAKSDGYTETILGRRRYLPDLNHENRFRREIAERAALNAPIQGSAADIIKLAMIKLNDELKASGLGARLLLQVHDELVLESSLQDLEMVKSLVKNVMESVIELSVPLEVSVGSGPTWLSAAH